MYCLGKVFPYIQRLFGRFRGLEKHISALGDHNESKAHQNCLPMLRKYRQSCGNVGLPLQLLFLPPKQPSAPMTFATVGDKEPTGSPILSPRSCPFCSALSRQPSIVTRIVTRIVAHHRSSLIAHLHRSSLVTRHCHSTTRLDSLFSISCIPDRRSSVTSE
jgi:hypothetical protein